MCFFCVLDLFQQGLPRKQTKRKFLVVSKLINRRILIKFYQLLTTVYSKCSPEQQTLLLNLFCTDCKLDVDFFKKLQEEIKQPGNIQAVLSTIRFSSVSESLHKFLIPQIGLLLLDSSILRSQRDVFLEWLIVLCKVLRLF